jgi:hypothetical protein
MTEQPPKSELGELLRSLGGVDALDARSAALKAYLDKVAHRMAQQLREAGGKIPAEYLIPAPIDAFQERAVHDFIRMHWEDMGSPPPYPKVCSILGPASPLPLPPATPQADK